MVASPMVAPRPAVRWVGVAREPLDLEARLVAQVHAPVALRRALARVAGRMVATRGWERLGSARPGDYAVECAGLSAREFRDLAAVDAALSELPLLDAAFRAGEIGWTQLRLLCRVAKTEDQQQWLALAARLTARELAREVRAVDRRSREPLSLDSECEDGKRVGVVLRLTPRARARWWSARQVANRVAGHALSHGAFAEVLAAEVLSGVPLDAACEAASASEPHQEKISDPGGPSPILQRRGPPGSPLPPDPEIAALEQDLDDCDAFELDRRLRRAVQMEARTDARVASLLSDVVTWGLHGDLGYRSVDTYAEERLGMAPSRARALLRIERAAGVCPPLRDAFADGRLSWVQAYALVPLLLEPAAGRYREGWVEHAQRISVRRLGDDVERALALGRFAPPPLESGAEGASPISAPTPTPWVSKRVPFHAFKRRVNASSSSPRPRSRSCSAPCWPLCSAGSSGSAAAHPTEATRSRRCSTTRSRPGDPRNAFGATTSCSSATAGAAPRRAARPTATCTATTSCSARTPTRVDARISPRCAGGTTSAASISTCCAARVSHPTGCASSSACDPTARRWRSTAPGR